MQIALTIAFILKYMYVHSDLSHFLLNMHSTPLCNHGIIYLSK